MAFAYLDSSSFFIVSLNWASYTRRTETKPLSSVPPRKLKTALNFLPKMPIMFPITGNLRLGRLHLGNQRPLLPLKQPSWRLRYLISLSGTRDSHPPYTHTHHVSARPSGLLDSLLSDCSAALCDCCNEFCIDLLNPCSDHTARRTVPSCFSCGDNQHSELKLWGRDSNSWPVRRKMQQYPVVTAATVTCVSVATAPQTCLDVLVNLITEQEKRTGLFW